jgi:hypothetical protein
MRTIRIILALVLLFPVIVCNAQTSKEPVKLASSGKVGAYYFHFTNRCVTCKTVELEAKLNIETLYPEQVKQGLVSFQSVNLDESSGKDIAKKLQVSGQTLLIVKGDQKINITNEGFMYAVSQPEKFKAVIKEKVDRLMGI